MVFGVSSLASVLRHRGSNMFLDGYKRNWLMTEGYSFEDMMIDDLSVSLACSINPVSNDLYANTKRLFPCSCL